MRVEGLDSQVRWKIPEVDREGTETFGLFGAVMGLTGDIHLARRGGGGLFK
jgi:hypothetical protein